ncbi:serine hydrolase [Wenzhouxiangella marina]|uniref:Penicillin-binding protein, beta-lactamase class C n=1 Tax=Wenzhouxiangella marina TaxID=1579979 RepID=A0A0K0XU79_9GAMM|nr:serine hydrolase [Wenzhouxiangella marina]AKS41192.1 Penicillin-binding protein, beta-lactamase class C [Wenzhouxiangella marina]MBB6088071.1 CubicO group peptidase (beta-lactamase class C family) [Wenzhouxiangella marina]
MKHRNASLRKRCLLALSVALLAVSAVQADDPRALADDPRVADAISLWSEWVAYQAGRDRVPAVSWGIVHDQDLIASGAFGLANPAEGIEATPDTLYSICSISKLFTSVGLMQRYDAGELRLDDHVSEHLDWFDIQDAHPDDEPITIRRLLTHSSGLPRESDFPYWTDADYPFPTSEEIRERLSSQQTLYPSSRYFQYSNLGLTLVGEIVAAVSGQSYDAYMREHLLDPLGMDSTTTDIPVELRGTRLAIGHTARDHHGNREVVGPFQTRGIAPAAGYASNLTDLAKFAAWQFRALEGQGDGLLRASTLREMQRVQWLDPDFGTTWGLGFSVVQEGDRVYARHGGGCPGYYTEFRLEPASKIGVIVLTNTIGSTPGAYAGAAFPLIGPAIASALASPEEAPERDGDLARYAGLYGTIWGRDAVVPWEDGLAILDLASSAPAQGMERLKHIEGHVFRRIRSDDSLGEEIRFELGADGRATRYMRHSIWAERVER